MSSPLCVGIAADCGRLFEERAVMADTIRRSLKIKKRYIEDDGFDCGIRNVFNYGHSFRGGEHYERMHPAFKSNHAGFESHPVPLDSLLAALSKDKKNAGSGTVALILSDRDGRMFKNTYANGRFDPVLVLDILHLHETWRETLAAAWRHPWG